VIAMENPFDPTAKLESRLRDDCFKIVSMVAMVAENPASNAHFIGDCIDILTVVENYLEEEGIYGDGREAPASQTLDSVDMLFLKSAESLKNYFRAKMRNDFDDDDEN
tara:strand:+ start:463 stop:786 length:324 start_codon:yes stop_codon:yes gene_type:complete